MRKEVVDINIFKQKLRLYTSHDTTMCLHLHAYIQPSDSACCNIATNVGIWDDLCTLALKLMNLLSNHSVFK